MSPSLLIDKLESLLPEIKSSGDPSGTLLKFAAEENLAPAQLEKMAHQYNTAKTLAFLKKASSRGGSFAIIDTEDLLARYTQPNEKAASVDRVSDWIDIPTEINPSRFPDMELLEMSQALKAAAAALPPETVEETPREKYARESAEARNIETLRQVREDFQETVYDAFAKFATVLYDNELPFAEIEDDAMCLLGKQASELIPELVAYLERSNIKVARMTTPAKRVLVRDRHGVMSFLKEAADAFDVVQGADFILKSAQPLSGLNLGVEELTPEITLPSFDPTLRNDNGNPVLDREPATRGPHLGGQHQEKDEPASKHLGADHGEPDRPARDRKAPKGEVKEEVKAKGESPDESKQLRDELGKGWDGFLARVKDHRPIKSPVEGIRDLASNFAGPNKRQEKIDTAADDTTFQTGVERLIHTDPILSEADPALVSDLANSVRRTNPQAALDLNYLKFTLREAVQYGALPHHTTKDLLTMRKELAQAQESEGKYSERLYGGGDKAKAAA